MNVFLTPENLIIPSARSWARLGLPSILAALVFLAPSPASAASGTWNVDADGSWNTPGNWVGGVIADGAGSTADFTTVNLTSDWTVDIDTTSRTVGEFLIGDSASNQDYTITSTTGKTLTFDNNGAGATLISSNGGQQTFDVQIILADDLTITKGAAQPLRIDGGITGTGNLTFNNETSNVLSTSNANTVNNAGTITNSGGGTGVLSFGAILGANVTSFIQDSSTSSTSITNNNNAGSFVGSIDVRNGTLTVTAQNGLDTNNSLLMSSGGTFQFSAGNGVTVAGVDGSGGILQGGSPTASRSLTMGGSGTYSYSGAITDNDTIGGGITEITKDGSGTQTLGGINTYTGDTTVTDGTLILASSGELAFTIGLDGVNNSIVGSGILTLDGKFNFDLTNAAATGSWNIVDVGSLQEDFTASFAVVGFTDAGSNTWTKVNGGSTYTFDEGTGLLTAIPEPSVVGLLMTGLFPLLFSRRRRTS